MEDGGWAVKRRGKAGCEVSLCSNICILKFAYFIKIESKSIKANSKLKATKKEHVNDKIVLKD